MTFSWELSPQPVEYDIVVSYVTSELLPFAWSCRYLKKFSTRRIDLEVSVQTSGKMTQKQCLSFECAFYIYVKVNKDNGELFGIGFNDCEVYLFFEKKIIEVQDAFRHCRRPFAEFAVTTKTHGYNTAAGTPTSISSVGVRGYSDQSRAFFRHVLSVPEHSHIRRKTLDAAGILVL